ncbi:MAG TPA: MipA/OmpV family protein, partial [Alphaproteobacteria bacterium]
MRTELSPLLSKKLVLLATTMLIGLGAHAAQAQDYGYDPNANYGSAANATPQSGGNTDSHLPGDLQLTVAVGVGASPEYFGSDDYEAVFTPAIDLEYHNAFLVYDRQAMMQTYEGLGYKILSNDNWALGVSLLYDPGRDDDSDRIRGMGDIDGTALAGGFASFQYGPVFARTQLHMDVLDE